MFLFCTLQVSSKVVELGISQWNIDTQRYGLVSYLPYMYHESGVLLSAMPIPIVTYDSIVYPFEQRVWGFTFASIIAQFLLLQQCNIYTARYLAHQIMLNSFMQVFIMISLIMSKPKILC